MLVGANNKYKRIAQFVCGEAYMCNKAVNYFDLTGSISVNKNINIYNNLNPDFNFIPQLLNKAWIVPENSLSAFFYNGTIKQEVVDQTIWIFNSYKNNYIFGNCYTYIGGIYRKLSLSASITPSKKCLFTFIDGSGNTFNGYGDLKYMVNNNLYPYFEMQTSSGESGLILMHWSYMIPVTPSDELYYNVPGTGISVPEFIANCN